MWQGHPQGPARPQAPPGADRAGHRARRHLHLRDVRAHRHPAQHVHHAVRQHLPEDRLPGPRAWPSSRAAAADAVRNPSPSRCWPRSAACPGVEAADGEVDGLRPVRRPRRQGRSPTGGGAHPRRQLRPQPADRPACASSQGRPADDLRRRGDGRRDGRRSTTSPWASRCGSCRPGPTRTFTITGHRPASGRPTTWPARPWPPSRCPPRRACSTRWASSTTSTW